MVYLLPSHDRHGIANNTIFNPIQGSAIAASNLSVPAEPPWLPTKVQNAAATAWTLNLNTQYISMKLGFYNPHVFQQYRYPNQSTIGASPNRYRVPLGMIKFTETYSFRMREDRNFVEWPTAPTLDLMSMVQQFSDLSYRLSDNRRGKLLAIEEKEEEHTEEKDV